MAKQLLDESAIPEFNETKRSFGGETRYPWDEWFDGGVYLIERSTGVEDPKTGSIVEIDKKGDYEVPTNGMPPKLVTAARRRYKVVQISRVDAKGRRLEDALIIRARDMDAEEAVDENNRRRAETAKLKAAVAAKKAGKQAAQSHASTAASLPVPPVVTAPPPPAPPVVVVPPPKPTGNGTPPAAQTKPAPAHSGKGKGK